MPFEAMALCISLATTHNEDLRDTLVECNEVEGLSLNPHPERIGVADISNEACQTVKVGVKAKTSFIVPTTGYQDLLEYLARPRLISSGSLPTTRTSFVLWDITRSNLTFNWFPNLLNRIQGVYGIRFTTRFTVMTASTPFQASLLCQSVQYGTTLANTSMYPRLANPAFVTNLPHVKHDIIETTMSIFDIPFLYPQDFMPLYPVNGGDNSSLGCVGAYALTSLMPYRALAGANAPTYKILVSLHDVELIGSMPANAGAVLIQSGLSDRGSANSAFKGRSSMGNATLAEEKSVKGSDFARKAATTLRTIAPYVPMLGSVGHLTANLLDVGANVASAFGFAKPQVQEAPTRVMRNSHIGEANVDIDTASYVLAPFQNNRLAIDALAGGTEVDEMAIQYVVGKYGQAFVGNMATTDATGSVLYGSQVCPTNFWFRTNSLRPSGNIALPVGSTAITNSIACTPLCYVSSFFRYWRGTMKFKFTFSKTKFHGGRVIVAFVPGINDPGPAGVLSNLAATIEIASGLPQPFSYCEVFDLKDSSAFEFSVPFVSPDPFVDVTASIGTVTMTVLDPLVTTGETSTSIDYLVEIKAEDDFQFGCPAPPMFGLLNSASLANIVYFQSGLGGIDDIDDSVTQYTTGESILSLKSLMMIPNFIAADLPPNTTSITSAYPYWYSSKIPAVVPLPPTTTAIGGFSRAGNIAAMYAFVSGSTEHHLYHYAGGSANVTLSAAAYRVDNGAVPSSLGDPRRRGIASTQRILTNDTFLHVRAPSYQRYARVPIWEGNTLNNFGAIGLDLVLASGSIANHVRLIVNNASGAATRIAYGRSAADDARCFAYIGPPPVALLQATQSVEPDGQPILF
ncbi:structural protein [Antarctic picorna-like virus 1]|uniref:structural protein n=1 Tax=Antarctic picorna-like virus 1 TaxID=1648481 RepID=UPI00067A5101|nr:structural protein [Antarctic picorna-like virus 1]AKG93961.1 structural protein [Antarctic picorna-like virus 1]